MTLCPPEIPQTGLDSNPSLCGDRSATNHFPWEDQLHGESWFNSGDVERSKISKLSNENDSIASFSVKFTHCCTKKSQHCLIVPPGNKQHWHRSCRRETQRNDTIRKR